MITPDIVIEALIDLANQHKDDIVFTAMIESSEDTASVELAAPWIIIYADFVDSTPLSSTGHPYDFPIAIELIISSSQNSTASKSFKEAFLKAIKLMNLFVDRFTLTNTDGQQEFLQLMCKDLPIQILKKSASQCLIKLNFTYNIPVI